MDLELSPAQMKEFQNAMLSAFPRRGELERLVYFNLEVRLDQITSVGTYTDDVFELIEWAISKGKLRDLLEAAHQEVPGNVLLAKFYESATSNRADNRGRTMAIKLTSQQMTQINLALLSIFPSRSSLEQFVFFRLKTDLNQITSDGSLVMSVLELVKWAEANGRLLDLLRSAHAEAPGTSDLDAIYSKITEKDSSPEKTPKIDRTPNLPSKTKESKKPRAQTSIKTEPPLKSNIIPERILQKLTTLLLELPSDTIEERTSLIRNLPGIKSLNRNASNARQDFEKVLSQLQNFGRTRSGEWPILVIIDNAITYVEGYELEDQLRAVREEIAAFYEQE
jgi:hypothetical protein